MTEPSNIGHAVKTYRNTHKMSRDTFARHSGLTPGAVWRIEAKNQLKPGELEKLTKALDSVVELPETAPAIKSATTVQLTIVDPPEVPTDTVFPQVTSTVPARVTFIDEQPKKPLIELPELPGFADVSPTVLSQEDGCRRVSNSEVQTFKRCRRKWWFGYYRALQPNAESPTGPRAIGDRLHRALRFHYMGDPNIKINVQDALEALIVSDWKNLVNQYLPEYVPLAIETQFIKDADLERIIIEGYLEWLAETGADSEYEVTGSEVYLEADLPDIENVKIIARLDARVRRISDGLRLFIDHKSVGAFQQLTKVLHLNEQMLWYILVEMLQHNDEGFVAGALYNMMRRVKRGPNAKPPFYERIEVHHNKYEIESFLKRVQGVVHDMEQARYLLDKGIEHQRVVYPTPHSNCVWDCPFFTVCGMTDDGSHAEGMLQRYFTQGDPLGYYAKGNQAG